MEKFQVYIDKVKRDSFNNIENEIISSCKNLLSEFEQELCSCDYEIGVHIINGRFSELEIIDLPNKLTTRISSSISQLHN